MPATVPMVDVESAQRLAPRWKVVLLNDDDHTYEYVIRMLVELFAKTPEQAYGHACEVDATGRTVVDTTTRERGELKVEQIGAYGPDPLLPGSRGSMSAELEPDVA